MPHLIVPRGALPSPPSGTAFIADYRPLEILQPRSDLPVTHRHLFAYPGLAFSIRCAVVGGSYPYTYSLTNGGTGMTIDPDTGVISWPNPTANCTPTVTVTDVSTGTASETWTITVDTSGWLFVDAVSGTPFPGGTGTIANPWRTLDDVVTFSADGDRVYFKSGTYNWNGLPTGSAGPEGLYLDVDTSTVWIAYPGDSPVIDFEFTTIGTNSPQVWLNHEAYLDGFEVKDGYHKFFQIEQFTIWNCDMWGMSASGVSNNSYVMTGHGAGRYGIVIQDSIFRDGGGGNGLAYLSYDNDSQLVEDCEFTAIGEGVHHKDGVSHYTFRGNYAHACDTYVGFGGNMNCNASDTNTTSGECCYNNFLGPFNGGASPPYSAIMMGYSWIRTVGASQFYRNTVNGYIEINYRQLGDSVDMVASDGPFTWSENVIVNSDTSDPSGLGFTHFRVGVGFTPVRWNRMTETDDLKGVIADGIIDQATGLLQGSYRTLWLGKRGHEVVR